VLAPSERAVIEVLFEKEGDYTLQNKTPERTYTLGKVLAAGESVSTSHASEFDALKTHEQTVRSIDPFRAYFSKTPDKRIALTIDMMGGGGHGAHMMPDGTMMSNSGMMMGGVPEGGIEWEDDMGAMNALSNPDSAQWHIVDQDTGKQDMNIDWSFKQGEPVKIRIFNDPNSMHPMQHPIHFHGQRFLVVARDGVSQTNLVWKDTVMVKAGETVDIILDTSNPGVWMAHCHIAEHLEAGMMMKFEVR
jgi:FtsP/CotA-like multicopper oxidase with cupredoxin domain